MRAARGVAGRPGSSQSDEFPSRAPHGSVSSPDEAFDTLLGGGPGKARGWSSRPRQGSRAQRPTAQPTHGAPAGQHAGAGGCQKRLLSEHTSHRFLVRFCSQKCTSQHGRRGRNHELPRGCVGSVLSASRLKLRRPVPRSKNVGTSTEQPPAFTGRRAVCTAAVASGASCPRHRSPGPGALGGWHRRCRGEGLCLLLWLLCLQDAERGSHRCDGFCTDPAPLPAGCVLHAGSGLNFAFSGCFSPSAGAAWA